MEAGPELDTLVAEKVMGWKRMSWREYHGMKKAQGKYNGEDDRTDLTYSWHNQDGEMNDRLTRDMSDYGYELPEWSPSTNIKHAWEVVEKFPACFRLEKTFKDGLFAGWFCEVSSDSESFTARGQTAPLAICLAALEAVGIED